MDDPFRRPSIVPAIFYRDPWSALDWLERVFGFTRSMVISTTDGRIAHAEMRVDDGVVYIGAVWAEHVASPVDLSGRNTQTIHIHMRQDLDAHCERARAAGAQIVRTPEDQFYGDRVYSARDIEGHYWSFGQSVRKVSREEAEAASGFKIDGWI